MIDRRVGELKWRTVYYGEATSVSARQLLRSADANEDDEYACCVTSRNEYGWSEPSDVLVLSREDARKLAATSGGHFRKTKTKHTFIFVKFLWSWPAGI